MTRILSRLRMFATTAALVAFLALPAQSPASEPAWSARLTPREGWSVQSSPHDFATLVDRLKTAAKSRKLFVVTQAGPTGAAKKRGIEIPGNRVIGLFNNDFAVRTLRESVAAMIEAPIRFYVTEDPDGSATLSWKTPSLVFAPYMDAAGPDLAAMASELDAIFDAIGARATAP